MWGDNNLPENYDRYKKDPNYMPPHPSQLSPYERERWMHEQRMMDPRRGGEYDPRLNPNIHQELLRRQEAERMRRIRIEQEKQNAKREKKERKKKKKKNRAESSSDEDSAEEIMTYEVKRSSARKKKEDAKRAELADEKNNEKMKQVADEAAEKAAERAAEKVASHAVKAAVAVAKTSRSKEFEALEHRRQEAPKKKHRKAQNSRDDETQVFTYGLQQRK